MNTRKIYACYQKDYHSNGKWLEFWSANKKLYDMYLSIYGKYLAADTYYHTIISFNNYEKFYNTHRMEMLDIFDSPPWYKSSTQYISTMQLEEICDIDTFLENFLEIRQDFSNIIENLPPRIRAVIYKTKWADIASDPLIGSYTNTLDIDVDKLIYLSHSCYYGNDMIKY